MKRKMKRILAGMIAFTMILSMNVFSIFAEELNIEQILNSEENLSGEENYDISDELPMTENDDLAEPVVEEKLFEQDGLSEGEESVETEDSFELDILGATIASGYCGADEGGQNLMWTITGTSSNYSLKISGTGAMRDYDMDNEETEDDTPWSAYSEHIKSVTVENGVSYIGFDAFDHFINMTKVTLPDSITEIGSSAFFACKSLKSITIPSKVTKIRLWTFVDCENLETVELPDCITKIDESAFSRCRKLKTVNMPSSLKTIGDGAFEACEALQGLSLPEGLKSIGEYAFDGCNGITKLNIPTSCTSLGKGAFEYCKNLGGRVNLPDGITEIPVSLFQGCEKLEGVMLPQSVTNIKECAFEGCESFASFYIPSKVNLIGKSAFSGCYMLQEIDIPEGLEIIKQGTFMACPLKRITIPSSVTKIESSAFYLAGPYDDSMHVYYGGSENSWTQIEIADENDPLTNAIMHYARDPETVLSPTPVAPANGATNVRIVDEGGFRHFELKLTADEEIQGFDVARGSIRICRFDTGEKVWELRYNPLAKLQDNVFSTTIKTGDLDYGTKYYVLLDDDFFWLKNQEKCLGIHNKNTWVFTTQRSPKMKEITLDPQGGNVSTAVLYTNNSGKLDSIPIATINDGRRFGGWFTDPVHGDKIDSSFVFKEDSTIYARFFEKNELIYKDDMAPVRNNIKYTMTSGDKTAFYNNLGVLTKGIFDIKYRGMRAGNGEGAFCYGAACAIVAAKAGSLDLSNYGATTFNQLDFKRQDVRSRMTIYQLSQGMNRIVNEQNQFGKLSKEEKLRTVVETAKAVDTIGPAVLVFYTDNMGGGDHAIVIDGIEEGNCKYPEYYYTIKTYDINTREADSFFSGTNHKQPYSPDSSYIYISEDFKKWTCQQKVYFKNGGEPLPAKYLKLCFNNEYLVNSYKYKDMDLSVRIMSAKREIGRSLEFNVDGRIVNYTDIISDDDTDVFSVGTIADTTGTDEDISFFFPNDFEMVTATTVGDEPLAATLRFDNDMIDVEANSNSKLKATYDLDQVVISGVDENNYVGNYAVNALLDEMNGTSIQIEGSTHGDVTFERTGDEYLLSADGNHNSMIIIDQDGITDRYPCVNQESLVIKKAEECERVSIFSDENGDGIYETQLQPIEGLWASNVKDQVFTGTKITQTDLMVFHDNILLKEGKDYTVKYKNNTSVYEIVDPTNLSTTDKKKAPAVTITGKGNYSGNTTVYFSILPSPIGNAEIMTDRLVVSSNKTKGVTPKPELKYNGKVLKEGKDYVVSYYERSDWDDPAEGGPKKIQGPIKGSGEYIIQIKAASNSNFSGTHDQTVSLLITESDETVALNSRNIKLNGKIPEMNYIGREVSVVEFLQGDQAVVSLSDGQYDLKYGEDFTISKYINAVNPGNATVVLSGTGKRNATSGHSYVGEKKVSFKIVSSFSMKNASVTNVEKNYEYPVDTNMISDAVKVSLTGYKNGEPLVLGHDYQIDYSGYEKPGKAKMTITGLGPLAGSKTVNFTVLAYQLSDENADISFTPSSLTADGKVIYHKGGGKPDVVVTRKDGKGTLKEGKDFTVKFSNNTKIFDEDLASNNAPKATITGKGNYKGSLTIPFAITYGLLETCSLSVDDKANSTKKGAWISAPKIVDSDGKTLKKNVDYDGNLIYATDPDFIQQKKANEILTLSNGEKYKTIYVKVLGIGNYAGSELSGSYRIVREDIKKATVTFVYNDANGKAFLYTGKAITPGKHGTEYEDAIRVTFGKEKTTLTADEDYNIIGFENNVKVGTAKVTIQGTGAYGGTKTIPFKVGARTFAGINLKRIREWVALLFD